jgi:hypothetical protein
MDDVTYIHAEALSKGAEAAAAGIGQAQEHIETLVGERALA